MVSQKCRYAVRALFELARRGSPAIGPVPIHDVAQAQGIPPRFLESILNQLRGGGFVASVRGKRGGYLLAHDPSQIRVGEVIRFISGGVGPLPVAPGERDAVAGASDAAPVFQSLWRKAGEAVADVFDATTIAMLVEDHRLRERQQGRSSGDYCI